MGAMSSRFSRKKPFKYWNVNNPTPRSSKNTMVSIKKTNKNNDVEGDSNLIRDDGTQEIVFGSPILMKKHNIVLPYNKEDWNPTPTGGKRKSRRYKNKTRNTRRR